MTATGNAAEGIPRGNIRGGRDPLAGGTRTEMQHYTAHVTWPRRLAARVIARSGMDTGCGATIFEPLTFLSCKLLSGVCQFASIYFTKMSLNSFQC